MTTVPTERCDTLADQVEALNSGTVTSSELVGRAIEAIEASRPTLNAFRSVRRDAALAEAADADRRLAQGQRLPLLGVPIAIKDDTDLEGEPTAFGCPADGLAPAPADSEMVRRLRAAGAVIVGKTNAPELGQWPITGGAAFGHTRNPWHRGRTPGGSSGGSAAVVAAGIVPAAIGSDGAGSVRIPASWTNLVGIKPQRGRIPTFPDPEAFHGLTVFGPLARTVADAALLLDTLSGRHPGDLHQPPPVSTAEWVGRDPGRLRIGLSLDIPFTATPTTLDPQVRRAVEAVARTLTALGHDVVVDNPRYGTLFGLNFLPRSMAGLEDWRRRFPDPSLLDHRTLENARNGRVLHGLPLAAARKAEPHLRRRIGKVFDRVDVVLAPVTATGPLRVDAIDGLSNWATDKVITAACPYTWPWNVLGWPSVAVPAGFTADGLPVGAQLMGNANSETLLVCLAAQLESELRWDLHTPEHWW
ncbi:amidase [Rhodococcus sp. D2-41]|uniref:amidase n=1 Tax=Speluncibacter jeojiensis TaxID=2710754 RepID=A0A9X4LXX8_9ACTN|nr:amidase [Rhodococcus sp. D2-41]MDG3011852.1 amidase [Rhodococcus sp. D2-41]MDG3013304.1 amidase [Corynebacteriales bacterium D3-21]